MSFSDAHLCWIERCASSSNLVFYAQSTIAVISERTSCMDRCMDRWMDGWRWVGGLRMKDVSILSE